MAVVLIREVTKGVVPKKSDRFYVSTYIHNSALLYMFLCIVFHKNSYQDFTLVHPSLVVIRMSTLWHLPCLHGSMLYSPRCIFLVILSNPIDSNALYSYQESNTNKICSLTHTKYSQVNTHFFVYRSFCISHMNCLT